MAPASRRARDLLGSPAAFRAHEHRRRLGAGHVVERPRTHGGDGRLDEHEPQAAGLRERRFERGGLAHGRHDRTPALLDRAHGHALPPLDAAAHRQRSGGHVDEAGDERLHGSHPEHHRVPHDVVGLVALQRRLRQRQREGQLRRRGFDAR